MPRVQYNPNPNPGRARAGSGASGAEKREGLDNFLVQADGNPEPRPLTGQEYNQWSDRLRDVEEMVDLPDVRNEIAGIRERAKSMRADFKRHGKEPQWSLVKSEIVEPLAEVRNRISEELARRESKEALVPIDRDPVPGHPTFNGNA